MRVAVIGSRSINMTLEQLEKYIPRETCELVSGGARGIDRAVREYAEKKSIKLTEFLPKYDKYKKGAPLKRNIEIIEYSQKVIAIWDGCSRGTKQVIDECRKRGRGITVYITDPAYGSLMRSPENER